MPVVMNPTSIKQLGTGRVLVELVERMFGQVSKGGIHIPDIAADKDGKDTGWGKVVTIGPRPQKRLGDRDSQGFANWVDCDPWPDGYEEISVGDLVLFPRDVELVIDWPRSDGKTQRYCIVHRHELIMHIPAESVEGGDVSKVDLRDIEVQHSF